MEILAFPAANLILWVEIILEDIADTGAVHLICWHCLQEKEKFKMVTNVHVMYHEKQKRQQTVHYAQEGHYFQSILCHTVKHLLPICTQRRLAIAF